MDNDTNDLPEATAGDHLYTVARAAAGSVPFVGAALAELFGVLVIAPLAKRREEWLRKLGERVLELEDRTEGLDRETLARDPAFLSAVLQASQAAERSHSEEKHEALRNAVTNVALKTGGIDDDMQAILMRLVADLTPSHLRLLGILDDPYRYLPGGGPEIMRTVAPGQMMISGEMPVTRLLADQLPDMRDALELLMEELERFGLVVTKPSYRQVTLQHGSAAVGMKRQLLTSLGRRLLQFVRNPLG